MLFLCMQLFRLFKQRYDTWEVSRLAATDLLPATRCA